MGKLTEIINYLNHRINSKSWRAFHSPYLFATFQKILKEKVSQDEFDRIESLRKVLLKDDRTIKLTDLGAGSRAGTKTSSKSISSIARTSLSLPFQCRFMALLAHANSSKNILELGTSLGISAAYLGAKNSDARVVTVEGDPEIAAVASDVFEKLNLHNIILINSDFETFNNAVVDHFTSIDLLFIDGNHRKESLLNYFSTLKKYFHEETIVIVDDIYWSKEMEEGWKELVEMPEITQSVNCYHFGLLFFKSDFINKQHHKVYLPFEFMIN